MMARWWGPKVANVCDMDVRVGGTILIHMQGPDGTVHPMTGIFDEVAEPECLVFRGSPVDTNGAPLLESLTTVTFHDVGGKTKIVVHASAAPLQPIGSQMLKGLKPDGARASKGWLISSSTADREDRLLQQRQLGQDMTMSNWLFAFTLDRRAWARL